MRSQCRAGYHHDDVQRVQQDRVIGHDVEGQVEQLIVQCGRLDAAEGQREVQRTGDLVSTHVRVGLGRDVGHKAPLVPLDLQRD